MRPSAALAAAVVLTLTQPACHRQGSQQLAGVAFQTIRNGHSNRTYLLIHGDESTARKVLREHLQRHPGRAWLSASPTRNVTLAGGGEVDPNRLFSRAGAERNLRRLNPDWTPERLASELDRLDRQRPALLKALLPPPGGLIVAVHNNSRGYDMRAEVPISNATSLPDPDNPGEFFLATNADDYRRLAALPYNVVLQNEAKGEDDGSLSRLAAARGIRYVNLEVRLGRAERQREMLDALERVLP